MSNHIFLKEHLAFQIDGARCMACHKWVLGEGFTKQEIKDHCNVMSFGEETILSYDSNCSPMIVGNVYYPFIPLTVYNE